MTDFIIEFKNSIPQNLCNNIISEYEKQDNKFNGLTISGVKPDVLDSIDFVIPKNDNNWIKIEEFLYKELSNKLIKYVNNISKQLNSNDYSFNYFDNKNLYTANFMIKKYEKNKGKYNYHIDAFDNRVITFIWYLNDVEEGGETMFNNDFKIKPEQGKLVLFPSLWTYPHSSKLAISNDKYVIVGWLENKI